MRPLAITLTAAFLATTALAEPPVTVEDELGILNPQDTGREMIIRKIEMG